MLLPTLVLAWPLLFQGRAPQDSLRLSTALALARERSPVMAAGMAGVREAEARLSVARAAARPRLGLDALYLRFQDPPAVSLGPLGSFAPFLSSGYVVELRAAQPIYTGGRVAGVARAAHLAREAAVSLRDQADVEVTAAVAHAFDDVLLARALVAVAEQAVAVLDSAQRVAEEHHAAGTVAKLDVLRAATRLASARAGAREASNAEANARDRLAALIGLDAADPPMVAGVLEYVPIATDAMPVEGLTARAHAGRPDIAALDATARSYAEQAKAAKAGRKPTLALYLSTLATRPELISGRDRWSWEWLGGVALSWSFFDFGATAGQAGSIEAAADRTRAEIEQQVRAADAAVRVQHRTLVRAAEDVAAGRDNVERAERVLRIAQDRYAEGAGIQLEVLEAAADLTRARADLLRAIHAHRSAAIELRRVVGLPADAPLQALHGGGEP